jgi:ABC-type Fe3+/spermidine/putrescine transport system ATPase subunit
MAGEYKPGQEVRVVLRPEMIRFAETKEEGKLTGKVQEVSFLGSMARYLVEMEGGDLISVDEHNPKRFRHKGSPVFLILDEEGLHLQKI